MSEWYTPVVTLGLVREVFAPGGIDIDPCSTAEANTRVRAVLFYDAASDSLNKRNAWWGNVFLNPPFGTRDGQSMQGMFFKRCVSEYRLGRVAQAILLLKAGFGYKWFRSVLAWPVCFLHERLAFVQPVKCAADSEEPVSLRWGARVQNPHGSVVVYMGPSVDTFANVFACVGSVPGFNSWALTCGGESS